MAQELDEPKREDQPRNRVGTEANSDGTRLHDRNGLTRADTEDDLELTGSVWIIAISLTASSWDDPSCCRQGAAGARRRRNEVFRLVWTNYNIAGQISGGFQIDTLIVPVTVPRTRLPTPGSSSRYSSRSHTFLEFVNRTSGRSRHDQPSGNRSAHQSSTGSSYAYPARRGDVVGPATNNRYQVTQRQCGRPIGGGERHRHRIAF